MNQPEGQITDRRAESAFFDVAGYQHGRSIGLSEISQPIDTEVVEASEDVQLSKLDPAAGQAQLETLVAACGVADDRSPFCKHKEQLLADLTSPYALYRFVKAHPELLVCLREHDALKDRARKIPKAKIALLCVQCKMRPNSPQERSSCSDWTIWLEQAEYKNIDPSNFSIWGMGVNFKDCRVEVRARRASGVRNERPLQFSFRQTAKGAKVSLMGRQFTVSEAVLKKVIALVERAAPEEVPMTNDDNHVGDAHA